VSGPDGSIEPGRRRLNLAWYDQARSDVFADHGLLEGTTSLLAGDVPDSLREELLAVANAALANAVARGAEHALERGLIYGTPLTHFWPPQMVGRRVAFAGDGARTASCQLEFSVVSMTRSEPLRSSTFHLVHTCSV
jgi:hypothetical protein